MTETYCNRRNFRTRFNFVYFVLLAESTTFSSIRKLCTHTSVCDIVVAVRKFIAYESSRAQEYEIFTRTKISAITVCERRSCMKNNGKSPTFKFFSGEERRPSEVQRVTRGWRLPGATHSSADPTWIRK